MSRGIGQAQREIIRVLRDADGPLLPFEVRHRAGIFDPTNARRSLRSLERRGIIRRDDAKRAELTFIGAIKATVMDDFPTPDPLTEMRRSRREWNRKMAKVRAEGLEKVRQHREEEARWRPLRYERRRRRQPGENEYRVLAVVARCSFELQKGMPKAAVVKIAEAGGPAAIRRAIRSLLDRAELQERYDGERVRLPKWEYALFYETWWDLVDPPLQEAKAQVVLDGYPALTGEGAEGRTP